MVETHNIGSPGDVRVALSCPSLIPPAADASIGKGATSELRRSMARFSTGKLHTQRRSDVERAIARIDPLRVGNLAMTRTHAKLSSNELDASTLGLVVPTEALALALGASEDAVDGIWTDVERIVRSIGRGEPVDQDSDAGCERVLRQFADHPDGAVAAVSLLYQVFDSTASLFAETVLAEATGQPRRSALDATVRMATDAVVVDSLTVGESDLLRLSLDTPDLEFGHGVHECPGADLARAIVDAMCATLTERGFRLQTERVTFRPNGRPDSLPMIRP